MLRFIAIVLVAGLAWFGVSQSSWMDGRPVERLLFVGHSRTYANDLPDMVASIANSAGSPVRYEATMRAHARATLKDHWENSETRELLKSGSWGHVIIQPNIVWRDDDEFSDFMTYGTRFASEAASKSKASVIVDWPMRDAFYQKNGWTRSEHLAKTETDNWTLASGSGAQFVDVAQVWQKIDSPSLPFSLYDDDDHPSVEGTYLVALVIAAEVTETDLARVDWEPWSMSGHDAALLRRKVQGVLEGG